MRVLLKLLGAPPKCMLMDPLQNLLSGEQKLKKSQVVPTVTRHNDLGLLVVVYFSCCCCVMLLCDVTAGPKTSRRRTMKRLSKALGTTDKLFLDFIQNCLE